MALPTNLRVEAVGITTTRLRWTDTVAVNTVLIQRSPDDVTYTTVTGGSAVAHGLELFVDETVDPDTKYWYKISQTGAAPFTTSVSVWTHMCETESGPTNALPKVESPPSPETEREKRQAERKQEREDRRAARQHKHDQIVTDTVNELSDKVEKNITRTVFHGTETVDSTQVCDACVSDGRLVLDCNLQCEAFSVVADEDINSISIINCPTCPSVDFLIPPGMDIGICGWPVGCYYDANGDDCGDSRIDDCPTGCTEHTSGHGKKGLGCKKAKPDPSCLCDFDVDDILTVKCCDETNATYPDCSLSCTDRHVRLMACGGCGPYQWEIVSGPGTVKPTQGAKVVVKGDYPSNTYHKTGGGETAAKDIIWTVSHFDLGSCGGSDPDHRFIVTGLLTSVCRDCSGAVVSCTTNGCPGCHSLHTTVTGTKIACGGGSSAISIDTTSGIFSFTSKVGYSADVTSADVGGGPNLSSGSHTFTSPSSATLYTADTRSQAMIDAGCNPSEFCDDSVDIVVRVTDKVGTVVNLIL